MARAQLGGAQWWRRWFHAPSWNDLLAGVSLAVIAVLVVALFQWRGGAPSWAPSSPAEYYLGERVDADQSEIPRPF
jgi:hypothetical protein